MNSPHFRGVSRHDLWLALLTKHHRCSCCFLRFISYEAHSCRTKCSYMLWIGNTWSYRICSLTTRGTGTPDRHMPPRSKGFIVACMMPCFLVRMTRGLRESMEALKQRGRRMSGANERPLVLDIASSVLRLVLHLSTTRRLCYNSRRRFCARAVSGAGHLRVCHLLDTGGVW